MLTIKTINEYDTNDFYRLYDNSWSGAIQTLDDIADANKQEEFMEYLDALFCDTEEVDATELNDYIWFERDEIYDALGLDEDGKLKDEEDDEEE